MLAIVSIFNALSVTWL